MFGTHCGIGGGIFEGFGDISVNKVGNHCITRKKRGNSVHFKPFYYSPLSNFNLALVPLSQTFSEKH